MPNTRDTSPKDIAIVGGGFCGCATVYFLKTLLSPKYTITLFEKSDRLGGRVRSLQPNGRHELLEVGGSIFSSNHRYMNDFVDKFGLRKFKHPPPNGVFSLVQGRGHTVFSSSTGMCVFNTLSFAVRYAKDLPKFMYCTKKHNKNWNRIYHLQDKGEAFDSPVKMLECLSKDFPFMLGVTFAHWLDVYAGLSAKFIKEVAYGFPSMCFAAGNTIHSFAGMASCSGFGTQLYSVVGGNDQIAQKLCTSRVSRADSKAAPTSTVRLNVEVTQIERGADKRFSLTCRSGGVDETREFDYVVLALPVHSKAPVRPAIDEVISRLWSRKSKRRFVEVNFTHFRGEILPESFGLRKEWVDDPKIGVTVLPTEEGYELQKILFRYFGRVWSPSSKTSANACWATFSTPNRCKNPERQIIDQYVLRNGKLLSCVQWFAYPVMDTMTEEVTELLLGSFYLDKEKRLIHATTLEYALSNMETALISGRNAALLIANEEASQ